MHTPVELLILDGRLEEADLKTMPSYATPGSAAIDLRACIPAGMHIEYGHTYMLPAGFAVQMSPDVAALVLPRSGLGVKQGLVIKHGVGLVDSDYQGQIMIPVTCTHREGVHISPMERVAQIVFVPCLRATFTQVHAFSRDSMRGAGGFGSTGGAKALEDHNTIEAGTFGAEARILPQRHVGNDPSMTHCARLFER